jgi:glycosyltransferase involved in cell wall biosynthesis
MRVVHLGAEPPREKRPKRVDPTIATVGHVIPRKRHEDVLEALVDLPELRWLVIGDGPSLLELKGHAQTLGVADRVEFTGQLPPERALAELQRCHVMALPSEDEAFGVAYIEALACGVPAIGCSGESGPEEIAALAEGMLLVRPRDPQALASAIRDALADPLLPDAARRSAAERFSWERCGIETVAAYRDALA